MKIHPILYYCIALVLGVGMSTGIYASYTSETFSGFSNPWNIAVDSGDSIWVTNNGNGSIKQLNSVGTVLQTFSGFGNLRGISIDNSDNIWVTNNGTIQQLSLAGTVLQTFSGFPNSNSISIDSSNNIWVTNNGNGTIKQLSSAGVVLQTFSGFSQPSGIAVDSGDNIWVVDHGNGSIKQLNSVGTVLQTFSGFSQPRGITVDSADNIWVTNSGNDTIQQLNSAGTVLQTFSGFSSPRDIKLDSLNNLWVTNYGNNTVTKLSLPAPTLEINFTTGAAVTAAITGGVNFNGSGDVAFSGSATDNVTLTAGNVKMDSAAPIASGKKIIAAGGSIEATAGFAISKLDVTSHALTVRATGGSAADISALIGSSAVELTGSTGFALNHDLSASGSALSVASSVPMSLGANAKLPTGNHQIAGTLAVAQNPASGSHYSSASMAVHELDVSASGLVAAAFGNNLTVTKVKLGAMTFAQNITAGTL